MAFRISSKGRNLTPTDGISGSINGNVPLSTILSCIDTVGFIRNSGNIWHAKTSLFITLQAFSPPGTTHLSPSMVVGFAAGGNSFIPPYGGRLCRLQRQSLPPKKLLRTAKGSEESI